MSYCSRVTLDASDYQASRLMRNISLNSYREHQALWKLFPDDPNAERDFLFRADKKPLQRLFYVVSQRQPIAGEGWLVESKLYKPAISEGQMLAFTLRVNPIVTRKDGTGKRQRHDVVMDEKHTINFSQLAHDKRPAMPELIQTSGRKWLLSRSDKYGFEIAEQEVTVESYDQHQITTRGSSKPIRYSTMDLLGVVRVTDVERFTASLLSGIGPAKAFGCGLMMVRRL